MDLEIDSGWGHPGPLLFTQPGVAGIARRNVVIGRHGGDRLPAAGVRPASDVPRPQGVEGGGQGSPSTSTPSPADTCASSSSTATPPPAARCSRSTEARSWLKSPPAVEVPLPEARRDAILEGQGARGVRQRDDVVGVPRDRGHGLVGGAGRPGRMRPVNDAGDRSAHDRAAVVLEPKLQGEPLSRRRLRLLDGAVGGRVLPPQRAREASPEELTNRILLFVLWYLDISLIVILSFILARNLIRLAVERRTGVLGSRFRTKLVLTYVGLTFVPVILIFLIATNLLQGSIDRWFSAPVETILRGGAEVTVQLRELVEENLERQAVVAAEEIRRNRGRTDLVRLQRLLGVDLVAVYQGRRSRRSRGRSAPDPGLAAAAEVGDPAAVGRSFRPLAGRTPDPCLEPDRRRRSRGRRRHAARASCCSTSKTPSPPTLSSRR